MSHRGEDHKADEHPGGADHESTTTTGFFDDVEAWEGHGKVDGAQNNGGDVAVFQAGGHEDGCAVVKEEVGACNALVTSEHK